MIDWLKEEDEDEKLTPAQQAEMDAKIAKWEEVERRKKEEDKAERKRLGWRYYLRPKYYAIAAVVVLFLGWRIYVNVSENNAIEERKQQSELVLELIDNGQPAEAMKILKEMDDLYGDKYTNVVKALCEKGYIDEAVRLTTQIHKPSSSREEYVQVSAKVIYDALLAAGRYDDLWTFHDGIDEKRPSSCWDAIEYYICIEDAVRHMCKNGKKQEAKMYAKEKSSWFEITIDNVQQQYCVDWKKQNQGYLKADVVKRLNNIINEY